MVPLLTPALLALAVLQPLQGSPSGPAGRWHGPWGGGMASPPVAAASGSGGPRDRLTPDRERSPQPTRSAEVDPRTEPFGALGRASLPEAPDPAWEALLARGEPDVELGGFLRMTAGRYESTGGANPNRVDSGLSISNARLSVDGRLEDVRVFVSLEASSEQGRGYLFKRGEADELQVLDAFGELALTPWASLQVGQFRPPVLFGALLDENDLLFVDRTFNSLPWQRRDPGAQVHLDGDQLEGWIALQNGDDGAGEDLAVTARATLRVFGEGEAPRREGAYDPDLGQTLYLGAAWHDDVALEQGRALAAEAFYTWERLSLSGEFVDHGEGLLGGHRFWSATGALALVPDTWEVALRYEDFSSRSDTYVWRLGLNRYVRGAGTKLQANVVRLEHDGAENYQTLVEIGLVASF